VSRHVVEEFQALGGNPLHGFDSYRQNLVGHDLIGMFRETIIEPASPCNPQFGVDVDDVDPRGDRPAQIIIVCSRCAVQSDQSARSILDLRNPCDVQVLFRCTSTMLWTIPCMFPTAGASMSTHGRPCTKPWNTLMKNVSAGWPLSADNTPDVYSESKQPGNDRSDSSSFGTGRQSSTNICSSEPLKMPNGGA
jgi:hypothetical protein